MGDYNPEKAKDIISEAISILKNLINSGGWGDDPYVLGTVNGLIFSLAVLEGKEPKFLEIF
jgi:hypothetical protein